MTKHHTQLKEVAEFSAPFELFLSLWQYIICKHPCKYVTWILLNIDSSFGISHKALHLSWSFDIGCMVMKVRQEYTSDKKNKTRSLARSNTYFITLLVIDPITIWLQWSLLVNIVTRAPVTKLPLCLSLLKACVDVVAEPAQHPKVEYIHLRVK